MARSFFGGIHPAGRKETTRRKPLMLLDVAPARVSIPLDMNFGTPAKPVVRVGEYVTVGQRIAEADGEKSAHIHSSVSGMVEAIQMRPFPWGGSVPSIVISNDGKNTPCPQQLEPLSLEKCSQEVIMERIHEAGITDMGRDMTPAHWKILRARGRADTLIVNAAESDPYVTADHRLLLERGSQILLGTRALARALGVQHSIIAVEGDKLNAVEALERRMEQRKHGRVALRTLPSRYPLGAEKQIVQAITGREVPPGGNALDVRCVVFNVAAVYAVAEAIMKGRPLTHRAVTISGSAVIRPRNLWVPIGTPLKDLVTAADGFREKPELMLLGGPMSGIELEDINAPVIKNTNSLLCLAAWERPVPQPPTTCIRCGQCVSACPMHLSPIFVHRALRDGDRKRLKRLHPQDCMECGCCSYICPSHIPLVEAIRSARNILEQEVSK